MSRLRAALVLLALTVAGCSGLKEALTSHVNVAARAGSQELSSARLAELMTAGNMPPRKDLALAVASLWVNYHLLARAAGDADTLAEPGLAEDAMWAQIAQRKLAKLQEERMKTVAKLSEADFEKAYPTGDLMVVRHILISADKGALKPAEIEAAKRKADGIRRQATAANFVSLVKQYTGDPGSKETGGEYVWPSPQIPQMVPEFELASRALKPGEISEPVQTQFGFHIILRESYAEAKPKFDSAYQQVAEIKAESLWLAGFEKDHDIKVKEGQAALVKKIAENVDAYRTNRTVMVTSDDVDLRASRVAHWIAAFPPQMRIRQQLGQLPDSIMGDFLKSLIRNDLMLKDADRAKLGLDPQETEQLRGAFQASVQNTMGSLQLLPSQLSDSAAAGGDRATVARQRVESYFERLIKQQAQFVDVSEPVAIALRKKYDGQVTESGIDRAVTIATELKAKADSVAAAAMPPSAVPDPGASAAPAAPPATTPPPSGTKRP